MGRENHQDIVQRVHDAQPPEHTAESVLAFVVRVIAALPRDERAGLLRKDTGENIVNFHGVMVSAGRICYPDGQLYKIATDIPATNAPVWNDDGPVDPARYFDVSPFLSEPPAPVPGPQPVPVPAPAPPPPPADDPQLDSLMTMLGNMITALESVRDGVNALGGKIDALRSAGVTAHLRF